MPVLMLHTFWEVFLAIINTVQGLTDKDTLNRIQQHFEEYTRQANKDRFDLMEGQQECDIEEVLGGEEDILRRVDDGEDLNDEDVIYDIFSSDEEDNIPDI